MKNILSLFLNFFFGDAMITFCLYTNVAERRVIGGFWKNHSVYIDTQHFISFCLAFMTFSYFRCTLDFPKSRTEFVYHI